MLGEAPLGARLAAPLKIVARKRLKGPSRWGVPADFGLIRNFTELVRAVGLDRQWDLLRKEVAARRTEF